MSSYDNESLYNALSELEVIEKNQLDGALAQSRQENVSLEDVLVEKDLISDENIGKTISELLSLPFIKLSDISIPTEILNLVPEVVAKKQKLIAFGKDKNGLSIAMSDPGNLQIKDFIEKKVGIPVIVYYATKRDVNNALYLYNKDLSSTFDEIIKENVRQASSASGKQADPPITKIVDAILHFAYQNKASDVHIEPEKGKSLIRFRIDGVLHDILSLPLELHKPIVIRIKVLSGLRTDEHSSAQDGKLQVGVEDEQVDVRVSTVPITGGEKIVMRLLSERSRQFSLIDLGLSQNDLNKVKKAYSWDSITKRLINRYFYLSLLLLEVLR